MSIASPLPSQPSSQRLSLVEGTKASVAEARGEPTWSIASLFPLQGDWTEAAFLDLDSSRLMELNDGVVEVLEMPDRLHQWLQKWLLRRLDDFVTVRNLGEVLGAPLPVRLGPGRIREPDVVFFTPQRIPTEPRDPHWGADLVMEIVSSTDRARHRDLVEKRVDYAAAGIPEYWIVDPDALQITVLTLNTGSTEYVVHGEFRAGEVATSVLLPEFAIDVSACFAAGQPDHPSES